MMKRRGTAILLLLVLGHAGCGDADPGASDGSASDGSAVDLSRRDQGAPDLATGPCGGANEPCCPGNTCKAGGCCSPAFGGGTVCTPMGTACIDPFGGAPLLCDRGSCGGVCGRLDQPCCFMSYCSAPNTSCLGGMENRCIACGRRGELCCLPDSCSEGTCEGGLCK